MFFCKLVHIIQDILTELSKRGNIILLVLLWILLGGKAWYDIFWVGNTPIVDIKCELDWAVIKLMGIWLGLLLVGIIYFILLIVQAIVKVMFNMHLRYILAVSVLLGMFSSLIALYSGIWSILGFVLIVFAVGGVVVYNRKRERLQLYKQYYGLYKANIKQKCDEQSQKG